MTRIPEPPRGLRRLRHVGPGLLWMVSAAGSGELLFTPRVGAQYSYALLWALLAAVAMKWFINREIGRYAVCTGASVIDGFARLPGPKNWALWVIVVPQLFVAVTSIAGLAGSAATALVLFLPGDVRLWMVAATLAASALVIWGRYAKVELAATVIAASLAITSLVAAVSVAPAPAELASGLVPKVPPGVDYGEVLPWLGFMLSGAAGLMWYSYWVREKGYGAAALARQSGEPVAPGRLDARSRQRLRGWLRTMTLDCSVAVVGTLIITLAFLILGAELLHPRGLVPDEQQVAAVLGRLLGDVWGRVGFWFMVLGVFVGFWDTVLSDQDGHGRLLANGARLLFPRRLPAALRDEQRLQRLFVASVVTFCPILLYLLVGQPVALLKVAGAIEAAHIPIVTACVLFLNRRTLPRDLRPRLGAVVATACAGAFFLVFAVLYVGGLAS